VTGERVPDRRVVLLLAGVVVAVLGVDVLSALVPGLDALLADAPVLVVVLVIGTVGVLLWTLTGGRRTR
jgi:hypothetical protein